MEAFFFGCDLAVDAHAPCSIVLALHSAGVIEVSKVGRPCRELQVVVHSFGVQVGLIWGWMVWTWGFWGLMKIKALWFVVCLDFFIRWSLRSGRTELQGLVLWRFG